MHVLRCIFQKAIAAVVKHAVDGHGLKTTPTHRDDQRITCFQNAWCPTMLLNAHTQVGQLLFTSENLTSEKRVVWIELFHQLGRDTFQYHTNVLSNSCTSELFVACGELSTVQTLLLGQFRFLLLVESHLLVLLLVVRSERTMCFLHAIIFLDFGLLASLLLGRLVIAARSLEILPAFVAVPTVAGALQGHEGIPQRHLLGIVVVAVAPASLEVHHRCILVARILPRGGGGGGGLVSVLVGAGQILDSVQIILVRVTSVHWREEVVLVVVAVD
mmetsp:Transcript_52197/g.131042  ORF Transcript_52197/g.131042 Transcript_52197/m.131042 type:complete len:273 (+) Transcript_52197:913-1731(+)